MHCQPIAPCFKGIPYPLKKVFLQNRLHSPITGEIYTVSNPPSVDHIIPTIKGGLTVEDNLWIIDRNSNTYRGKLRLDKFFRKIERRNPFLKQNIEASFAEIYPIDAVYVENKIPIISRYLGKRIRV